MTIVFIYEIKFIFIDTHYIRNDQSNLGKFLFSWLLISDYYTFIIHCGYIMHLQYLLMYSLQYYARWLTSLRELISWISEDLCPFWRLWIDGLLQRFILIFCWGVTESLGEIDPSSCLIGLFNHSNNQWLTRSRYSWMSLNTLNR